MSWLTLANNQMVSYTDAQGGGFTLKSGQSNVNSLQCMTKLDALTKYNLNATSMSSYTDTQLVPKIAWISAVTSPVFIANGVPTAFTGTTVPVPYPTTVSAGDFMLLMVRAQTPNTTSTPSGWTAILPQGSVNSQTTALYYQYASGSEGGTSQSVITTGAAFSMGMIMQYRNVHPTAPFSPAPINAQALLNTTGFSNPNNASTAANQLGVALFSIQSASVSSNTPGAWTYRSGGSTSVGTGHTLVFATQALPISGTAPGFMQVFVPSSTSATIWSMFLNPI